MAEGYTDYVLNKALDTINRAAAFSIAANYYMALYDGGSEVDTGVWTNYARVTVVRNTTNFGAGASGDATTLTVIDFGTAAVTGGPEHVSELRIYDDPSAGNLLFQALLNSEKDINNGDPVTIPIGDLDFSFSQT